MIAEMRGLQDENGRVIFFQAVAHKFIPVEFNTVDTMSTITKQFIEEMMPMHPIYLNLLPDEIRQSIGRVHHETEPALKLLKSEGFEVTDLVDIFDAGPVVSCETQKIKAVCRTKEVTVSTVVDEPFEGRSDTILCSWANAFTSVLTRVQETGDDSIAINQNVARALELDAGSKCYLLPARR